MAKEGLNVGDKDVKRKLEEVNAEFEPWTKLMEEVFGDKIETQIVSDRIGDSQFDLAKYDDDEGQGDDNNLLPLEEVEGVKDEASKIAELRGSIHIRICGCMQLPTSNKKTSDSCMFFCQFLPRDASCVVNGHMTIIEMYSHSVFSSKSYHDSGLLWTIRKSS